MHFVYLNRPINFARDIVRSPFGKEKRMYGQNHIQGYGYDELVTQHPAWNHWWNGSIQFESVYCSEHDYYELVPHANYHHDLYFWYRHVKEHPRFSIKHGMKLAGFRIGESYNALRDGSTRYKPMIMAVHQSRTLKEFVPKAKLLVPVWLRRQGHRYRVTQEFRRKWDDKTFSAEDFFREQNQELRRLILRRGVKLEDVTKRLTKISQDDEGILYEDERHRLFLQVICPSTDQKYLLGIIGNPPNEPYPYGLHLFNNGGRKNGEVVWTPKVARRWTMRLPPDVEMGVET